MTLTIMPVSLKETGKMIMELPTMEFAMATPVMKVDLPMVIYLFMIFLLFLVLESAI